MSCQPVIGAALLGVLMVAAVACGQAAGPVPAALPADLTSLLAGRMGCGAGGQRPVPVVTVREYRYDFTGDGVPDAVVGLRCDTGAGNPPSVVFAVAAAPGGPGVPEELLGPGPGEILKDLRSDAAGLAVVTYGYGDGAPRCCPDLEVTRRFVWDGVGFAPGATTRRALRP